MHIGSLGYASPAYYVFEILKAGEALIGFNWFMIMWPTVQKFVKATSKH